MKGKLFLVSIAIFLLFSSLDYASGTDLFPVEPTRFFSSDWMMWWFYADKGRDWVQIDTTLKDAGLTWTQPYWEWVAIESAPSGSAETGIIHNYNTANLILLSEQIAYLKGLNFRIALVIDPSMALGEDWRGNSLWIAKVRAGDEDAQQAFYETMKYLATRFKEKVDAWQIDQESSDPSAGGYYRPQAFARLLRAGYRGIKEGDPQAFVYWSDDVHQGWTGKVFAYLAENYSGEELFPFTDGLAPHLFRKRGPDHEKGYYPPANSFTGTLEDALTLYHLFGRDYGVIWENTTPIGMVQTPYSTYAKPGSQEERSRVTFEQQANYRVRKAIIELALGYVWSNWSEHLVDWGVYVSEAGYQNNAWVAFWSSAGIIKDEGDTTGLVDKTGDSMENIKPDPPYREKKAWWALNTLGGSYTADGSKRAGVLKGTRFLSRLRLDRETQHGYRFLNPKNENMVTVIWDSDVDLEPSGTNTITLKSPGTVDIISRDGDFLFSRKGTFNLDIGPAPQYIIGTLVETNRASVHKISNDGLPAVWGYRDAYVIDIQTETAATRVKVTVPDGWTPPQTTDSTQAGYTVVDPGPLVELSRVTTAGSTIIIEPDKMPAGSTLRIYYGDVRGQAMLLDPGLNGVLADYWTGAPKFLAPPDNAYHKPARTSVYKDFLGYGFDRPGTGAWCNKQSSRDSIFGDGVSLSNTDSSTPWILKAKAGADSYQVKVYRADSIIKNNDDYLKDQRITTGNNDTPEYETDSVVIFTDEVPQNGLLSVNVSPVKNPKSGKWIRALYGVDIWPSDLGAGPEGGASLGENRFKVQITPSRGVPLPISPLSPGDLTITVVKPIRLPPVAYWPMDEGRGNTISDATSNEKAGTINGAAWTRGRVGSALEFDGVDDYVIIPDTPNSSLDVSKTVTVGAWIYPTFTDWPKFAYIAGKREAYSLALYKGGLYFAIRDRGNMWRIHFSEVSIPRNKWSYVAGIFDRPVSKIYINGDLVSTMELGGRINSNDMDFTIGCYIKHNDQKKLFFQGIIDEVKVYDKALTDKEVEWEYLNENRLIPARLRRS